MHIQQSVNTVCYLYFINTDNLSLKYSGYESRQLKIDIVNIGWHIYLKDITDYAARSKDW